MIDVHNQDTCQMYSPNLYSLTNAAQVLQYVIMTMANQHTLISQS